MTRLRRNVSICALLLTLGACGELTRAEAVREVRGFVAHEPDSAAYWPDSVRVEGDEEEWVVHLLRRPIHQADGSHLGQFPREGSFAVARRGAVRRIPAL